MVGEHALRHPGHAAADLVEARRAVKKVKQDYAFPFAVDEADGRFYGTAGVAVEAGMAGFGHSGILFDTICKECAYFTDVVIRSIIAQLIFANEEVNYARHWLSAGGGDRAG